MDPRPLVARHIKKEVCDGIPWRAAHEQYRNRTIDPTSTLVRLYRSHEPVRGQAMDEVVIMNLLRGCHPGNPLLRADNFYKADPDAQRCHHFTPEQLEFTLMYQAYAAFTMGAWAAGYRPPAPAPVLPPQQPIRQPLDVPLDQYIATTREREPVPRDRERERELERERERERERELDTMRARERSPPEHHPSAPRHTGDNHPGRDHRGTKPHRGRSSSKSD